mmetsp:Transcript_9187/g.17717  ORF Transcript_9187/g.17717 Transcript_9187/m.17717 type:complete len:233 (-) Transcript_9187:1195-1893(-)
MVHNNSTKGPSERRHLRPLLHSNNELQQTPSFHQVHLDLLEHLPPSLLRELIPGILSTEVEAEEDEETTFGKVFLQHHHHQKWQHLNRGLPKAPLFHLEHLVRLAQRGEVHHPQELGQVLDGLILFMLEPELPAVEVAEEVPAKAGHPTVQVPEMAEAFPDLFQLLPLLPPYRKCLLRQWPLNSVLPRTLLFQRVPLEDLSRLLISSISLRKMDLSQVNTAVQHRPHRQDPM